MPEIMFFLFINFMALFTSLCLLIAFYPPYGAIFTKGVHKNGTARGANNR